MESLDHFQVLARQIYGASKDSGRKTQDQAGLVLSL
jgi:hypothetical protein